jgi:hypothetical protein
VSAWVALALSEQRPDAPARPRLKAAYDGPIDVNNPRLPERWVHRWVAEEMTLKEQGLSASDLTPDELRAHWPKRLATWFEKCGARCEQSLQWV